MTKWPLARPAWLPFLLVVLVLGSCSKPAAHPFEEPSPSSADGSQTAATDELPGVLLEVDDPRINEISGLARSYVHPGVLYVHNDNAATEIFAIDRSGTRAVLRLDVSASVDWEDIASTPDGRIWVGDIGDNNETRTTISVVVFEEPHTLASATLPTMTFRLRYPDGPHDAEALLVDPETSRVYVVSKAPEGAQIYVAPERLTETDVHTLLPLQPAPATVTAGDFAPAGQNFVLRSYGRAFYYLRLGAEPVVQALPEQEQGEAITFDQDGNHILLASEGTGTQVLREPVPDEISTAP